MKYPPRDKDKMGDLSDHFVAYRGSVIQLMQRCSQDVQFENSCARIRLYRYTDSSQTFIKTEKTLPFGISGASVLKFKCVLDRTSGLNRPCLLVQQLRKKRSGYIEMTCHVLFLSENFDSFLTLGCFDLNLSDEDSSQHPCEIKLFDGPCVCWTGGTSLYFVSAGLSGTLTVTSHLVTELIPNVQPNGFVIHWCGNLKGETVAMGTTKTAIIDETSMGGKGLSWKWVCVNLSQGRITAPNTCFVPAPYVSIVTCYSIFTTPGAFGKRSGRSSVTKMNHVQVFIATNQGQLLEFKSGHLNNCWKLPFVDPCNICTMEVTL